MTKIPLTRRESQVVRLLGSAGANYGDVATVLRCSPETVRTHVKAVASRLPYHHLTPKAAVRHYAVTVLAAVE